MATMTVRNLSDDVHRRIRIFAAERGISVEAATRFLLDEATKPKEKLGDAVSSYAREKGAVSLEIERDKTPVRTIIDQ